MHPFSPIKRLALAAAALAALSSPAQALTLDTNEFNCTGNCGNSSDAGIGAGPTGNYGFVSTNGTAPRAGLVPAPLMQGDTWVNGSVATSTVFAHSGGAFTASFNFASTDGDGFADLAWARVIDATSNNSAANTVAWLFTARATNSGSRQVVPGNLTDPSPSVPTATILNYASYEFNERNTKNGGLIDWAPLGPLADNGGLNGNGVCWDDKASGCGFTGWLNTSLNLAAGNYRLEVGVVNHQDTLFDSGLAFDVAHLTAPVPEPGTAPMMLAALAAFGAFARRRLKQDR